MAGAGRSQRGAGGRPARPSATCASGSPPRPPRATSSTSATGATSCRTSTRPAHRGDEPRLRHRRVRDRARRGPGHRPHRRDIRTGEGMGWGEHDPHVHLGMRAVLPARLRQLPHHHWIPALDGVPTSSSGHRGRRHRLRPRRSTIRLAEAYPNSTFVGFDPHDRRSSRAQARRGRRRRRPGDLRARDRQGLHRRATTDRVLRLPARPGRPGRRLAPRRGSTSTTDGTLLLVEPERGRRRRGEPQSRRRRLLRLLDTALHAELARAGGDDGAGHAGGAGPAERGRARGRAHAGPAGGRDAVQHGLEVRPRAHCASTIETVPTVDPGPHRSHRGAADPPPSPCSSRSATRDHDRKLAERAGVNHGLVHYYFGSMEDLLLRVVERFTEALIERQRPCTRPTRRSSTSGGRPCGSSTRTPTPATTRSGSSPGDGLERRGHP